MGASIDPATRPSRLSPPVYLFVLFLLALSFITGLLVWRGQSLQLRMVETPFWLRSCIVLHGSLSPFLCGLFGYLCCQHIRAGWQLKANRITGLAMELMFAGLILSGIGLYYAGPALWREAFVLAHRILGLLMPLSLAAHWVAGLRWAKKVSK